MPGLLWSLVTAVASTTLIAAAHAAGVCNAGVPGENSAQVLQRLPKAMAECHSPALVIIFVGMNDAVNEKRFLTPDETALAVKTMLRAIRAADAKAFLVTVHYPDAERLMQRHSVEAFAGMTPAERIDATNGALRQAAKEEDARIVDFQAAVQAAPASPPILNQDGVHLSAAGYKLLAEKVAEALPPRIHGNILCLGDSLTFGIGVRAADAPDAGSGSYPQQLKGLLEPAL